MVRIMIVDDEADIRELLKDILELDGYDVVMARSGKECLSKLKKLNCDLILLDIMMPGMSGFEVQDKLNADSDTKDIPVVMVSARKDYRSKAITKHGTKGAAYYLEKPFKKNELLRVVRKALLE